MLCTNEMLCVSDQISARFALEIKRMQRRRQLPYPTSSSSPPPASYSPPQPHATPGASHVPQSTHTSIPGQQSPGATASLFNALSPSKKDAPLFTFKQVSLVCERMLKEREDEIRQEYDQVLSCKLAGTETFYFSQATRTFVCVQTKCLVSM